MFRCTKSLGNKRYVIFSRIPSLFLNRELNQLTLFWSTDHAYLMWHGKGKHTLCFYQIIWYIFINNSNCPKLCHWQDSLTLLNLFKLWQNDWESNKFNLTKYRTCAHISRCFNPIVIFSDFTLTHKMTKMCFSLISKGAVTN